MKKRLRKKLRLGEFVEYGFVVSGVYKKNAIKTFEDDCAFIDDLIDRCEEVGLDMGGGCGSDEFNWYISRYKHSCAESDRSLIEKFLNELKDKYSFIDSFILGPLTEGWHTKTLADDSIVPCYKTHWPKPIPPPKEFKKIIKKSTHIIMA